MAADDLKPVDLDAVRTTLASEGNPWVSGDTSMSILTEEERRNRLGVPLPPAAEVRRITAASAQVTRASAAAAGEQVGAPAAFDARNVGGSDYTTSVKDQGNCGSCVAFGTAATMETTIAFTRGQPAFDPDLSESHLFYVHGLADGATCSTGWLPSRAFAYCQNVGITFEDYFPYTPGNSGGAVLNGDWPNRLARVVSYKNLTGNVAAIKEHLSTRGAVSACFIVYQDFFSYKTGVYRHVTGGQAGGHCVSLVGYDDAMGCWIAKNSWSAGWGDNGYVRIAYGECGIESWEVHGADAVSLRMWTGATNIVGLYHAQTARSGWAYIQNRGWLKVTSANDAAHELMLSDLVAARVGGRQLNVFENNGTIDISLIY
jgi:C1A family cysteine protease